ncbi:sensor histidine kinase [Xylanibacillus composti]|uniref:histidine kinase n=1 Tax=Xylanibacillus composti TaxID=1572762 RepID=A0A8J4H7P6_9BACL|nr:HAMP domain-containing sensor histidine kinase [Xylanibacillus composti]MDT9725291.1 sensor histidine kinase [Xylanibacillus composti]GIQ70494.1 two-component sensor histidine kinase [Xylanibacillus composti]
MSIRLKLILTYLFGILFTAIIVTVTGIGIVTAVLSYIGSGIVKEQTAEEAFHRGIDLIVELRYAERYTPEKLTSPAFANMLGNQLEPFGGFLVVRQGERWESYGALSEGEPFLAQLKRDISAPGQHKDEALVVSTWEGRELLAVRYDFPEIDEPLSYFLVADVTDTEKKSHQFQFFLLLVVAVVLGIILVPLLWITTKDIIRPLRQLEQGSRRIAEGDLNFSLHTNVRNEVGSVIRSYEKMRSELQRSIGAQLALEENRKQLVSNISHDLKTPLTSIKGYVEGIREGIANDPEKLKKYIDVIHSKTLDMDRMIDDLFLFSKLDLDQERFHLEAVQLEEFYRQTMNELHMEYESAGVRLTSEYEAGSDAVARMDASMIKRVILNIVGNSVKFVNDPKPHVHVHFGRQAEEWVIAVTDNGPGMEPDELERIFDRFYRGDANRNQNVAGSGLGLAIAKQIVAYHGGIIHARSEPGRSMTVMFTIPINQDRS